MRRFLAVGFLNLMAVTVAVAQLQCPVGTYVRAEGDFVMNVGFDSAANANSGLLSLNSGSYTYTDCEGTLTVFDPEPGENPVKITDTTSVFRMLGLANDKLEFRGFGCEWNETSERAALTFEVRLVYSCAGSLEETQWETVTLLTTDTGDDNDPGTDDGDDGTEGDNGDGEDGTDTEDGTDADQEDGDETDSVQTREGEDERYPSGNKVAPDSPTVSALTITPTVIELDLAQQSGYTNSTLGATATVALSTGIPANEDISMTMYYQDQSMNPTEMGLAMHDNQDGHSMTMEVPVGVLLSEGSYTLEMAMGEEENQTTLRSRFRIVHEVGDPAAAASTQPNQRKIYQQSSF